MKSPKLAVIEQATLDHGVKLLMRECANRINFAYDPSQTSPLDARLLAGIYVDYTEGKQVDGLRELGRTADKVSREMYSIMLGEIDRTGDGPGIVQQALVLMQQVLSEAGSR